MNIGAHKTLKADRECFVCAAAAVQSTIILWWAINCTQVAFHIHLLKKNLHIRSGIVLPLSKDY